jgi:hypothetical protein
MKSLIMAWLLIAIGTGWLLTALGVGPGIDWVWTIGLAALGLLTFLVGGFDKLTLVVGPVFLIGSGLSILRQTNQLSLDVEIPVLVILSGVLVLIARTSMVPMPRWIILDPVSASGSTKSRE